MDLIYKHFKTIDSTNTWGKLNCHLFKPDQMTLITADSQTAGRGRFKREWISPPTENIYATFCFTVDRNRSDIGNLPQILALSAAKTLQQFQFKPKLKWPNDILLSEKKVAGILCETVSFPNYLMVILGIGLNVNMSLKELQTIDRPATSLKNETAKTFEVQTVLKILETNFLEDLDIFIKKGFSPFLKTYRELIEVFDYQKISFHDNLNVIEGTFHSINDDGTLNLLLENGTIKKFISGEFLQ